MKTATIAELKKTLSSLDKSELLSIALRLAKHKKENKELLTYLLYEAADEEAYAAAIEREIDQEFRFMNRSSLYYVKKSLRKLLRFLNKYVRFSGDPSTEARLRIYFCEKLQRSGIDYRSSQSMVNLEAGQLKKIRQRVGDLHEDKRGDFSPALKRIGIEL